MRRIQKIIQQRRRQLHVHIPPSELKVAMGPARRNRCHRERFVRQE